MKLSRLSFAFYLLVYSVFLVSCNVEFSPNAQWRDIPSVYCVIDPEEDTVWARVQRCYLGDDTLYNYSTIADSTNYPEGSIRVKLLAWRGQRGTHNSLTSTGQLVDSWDMTYTEIPGKPDGNFASGSQPIYYCVPGRKLMKDTACVFELLVMNQGGDTIARAVTTMVGILPSVRVMGDSVETVLVEPNSARGHAFGYRVPNKGEIKWNTLPRGRRYQPTLLFYYAKYGDTLSIPVKGSYVVNTNNDLTLSTKSITQERLLSYVKESLKNNTDTLRMVNLVGIMIDACNEDLHAYLNSQGGTGTSSQDYQQYSNIEGGVGVFGSRRTHIMVNVPCDSSGKDGYLAYELKRLHVGFLGDWGK